ncbi:efflux RND transporter permease subunit, partial [Escherichia coli]
RRMLAGALRTWPVLVVFGLLVLFGNAYLFINSSQELAPEEDQGIVLAQTQGAPDATIEQMAVYSDQVYRIARAMPEYEALFQLDGQPTLNSGIS